MLPIAALIVGVQVSIARPGTRHAAAARVSRYGATNAGTTTPMRPSRRMLRAGDVMRAVRTAAPRARLGAVVDDLAAHRTVLAIEPRRVFRSASLVKLLIAIDALRRRELTEQLRDQLHRMLALSDDDIASTLWVAGGGPAIVERSASLMGLPGTRPAADPGIWGNTLVTASDIARVYRYILTELPAWQRRLIMDALRDARRRAADGWDQYFGIPDAAGDMPAVSWAVKQGWSDSGDDLVLHSTGVLCRRRHCFIVVLLISDCGATGWRPMRRALTAAAAAIIRSLPA